MQKKAKTFPVAPNSVYVWRGFKSPQHSYTDFVNFLGGIFVPACALLQPKVGLRAYLPTLIPQSDETTNLPDQTALMFWDNPGSHNLANECLAVRVYQNLHGDLYDMVKSKLPEVPIALPSNSADFISEQPYYLFENSADWMLGQTRHFVAAKPTNMDQKTFLSTIFQWSLNFKNNKLPFIDAGLVCCDTDYVVIWVHSPECNSNLSDVFKNLESLISSQFDSDATLLSIDKNLWSNWAGINLGASQNVCINIQLDRPTNVIPN